MRRLQQQAATLSRRSFIAASAAAAGSLTIGFHAAGAQEATSDTTNPFQAYLRISPDHTVTVLSAHMEGGQGIYSGLATLIAEELDADWEQMSVEGASGNPDFYGNKAMGGAFQLTGGSTAMVSSWQRYREAGAIARHMLVEAAAQQWSVVAEEIRIDRGVVSHPSGREGRFGDFVADAAGLPVPAEITLKPREAWRYIGNDEVRRRDTVDKTRGQQDYTIDVQLPGMLTAVLKRPPRFGGKVAGFDAEPVKAMQGVVDVVETPRGVAVVAKSYWEALKGRDALRVEWDESEAEKRGTAELIAMYKDAAVNGEGVAVHGVGDAMRAMDDADKTLDADFEFPFLAHAAMEPLNAVARFQDGQLEIWAGHQMPDQYQAVAADILGIDAGQVILHVMMTGDFFGRRAAPDSDVIVEVASIVKALGEGVPVRVQWSREDDMHGGKYRPMYVHKVQAGIDANGNPLAWSHHVVGQSIMAGTPFEAVLSSDGIDATSVEGVDDMPYSVPNFAVRLTTTDVNVPVLWWRSVGHTHTAFVVETVVDDLARMAGRDPVEFRQELLSAHPRHLGVLNLVAEKAGWDKPAAEGIHRGIAVHHSFGSYVAQVAEIRLREDGTWKAERVVCAVDCGIAVNPDTIRAQMEGGIGFALAGIVHGEISLTDGHVDQDNYDGYRVLRMNEMPDVEVHIVESDESPTGVGEPGVPPLGPALSNALTAATGVRKRVLPLGNQV